MGFMRGAALGLVSLATLGVTTFAACGSGAEPATTPGHGSTSQADLLAAELAAYEQAKPVFERECKGCHVPGAKDATDKSIVHFDMSTYPFGGHHGFLIYKDIRRVLGIS